MTFLSSFFFLGGSLTLNLRTGTPKHIVAADCRSRFAWVVSGLRRLGWTLLRIYGLRSKEAAGENEAVVG